MTGLLLLLLPTQKGHSTSHQQLCQSSRTLLPSTGSPTQQCSAAQHQEQTHFHARKSRNTETTFHLSAVSSRWPASLTSCDSAAWDWYRLWSWTHCWADTTCRSPRRTGRKDCGRGERSLKGEKVKLMRIHIKSARGGKKKTSLKAWSCFSIKDHLWTLLRLCTKMRNDLEKSKSITWRHRQSYIL